MKGFFATIGIILLCLIFIPLFLFMLFGMPLEFMVSSWQLIKLDAKTQGIITHSEIKSGGHGTQTSSITYTFQVDGKTYESSRWQPGWISNGMSETNGGQFSRSHPEGANVIVYYDSSNPHFSVIAYGWPKWSVGFSLAVWGIIFANRFKRKPHLTKRLIIYYPLSHGVMLTGFATLFFFPQNLDFESIRYLMLTFLFIAISALFWLFICSKTKLPKPS